MCLNFFMKMAKAKPPPLKKVSPAYRSNALISRGTGMVVQMTQSASMPHELDTMYNKIPFLRPPYTKKCHFRDPPIQQNAIFETPLYKKMPFLRPPIQQNVIFRTPYTKKCHFRDPPIQQNGIFETPLYKKMPFLRPPYTTKCHFRDPPIQKIGIFETPLYKKIPSSPLPIFKWNNPY